MFVLPVLGVLATDRTMVQAQATTSGRILDPRLAGIDDVFRENFAQGLESAGASFAVYLNGNLVVDLWGGPMNKETGELWSENTSSVIFSITKSISATILAMVMDKENVPYERKLSDFWPEFAQNGKENVTIMNVVHHQ
ncbi:unnamed protein product, partial [Nippostrongylus brasiliensis]|uniref:Beta-lactamase domain-containing protein n=1 Tax=Nippostrongylus brasiliensis TaxID=27835 RepID=A0A0N4XJ72_NIPBR